MPKTHSGKIKRGKYTYEFAKVYREDGSVFYMGKRSDSKKSLYANIFQTKRELMAHYPSIAGEIEKLKFKPVKR